MFIVLFSGLAATTWSLEAASCIPNTHTYPLEVAVLIVQWSVLEATSWSLEVTSCIPTLYELEVKMLLEAGVFIVNENADFECCYALET